MAYDLQNRLVIGIASSALFDLQESDAVFNRDGEDAYREYQEAHLDSPLQPGIAFPFITRLLALNNLGAANDPLVEVIILSRNDPDTGLRVMRSVQAHDLSISRAIFMLNDLIHATAISLIVPAVLEADEIVQGRPSLAAGNDPTRPYDLRTSKRVAEFKLAQWAGADAMRKRGVFKDLVHLAVDDSGRRAQLFVVGQAPIKFLRECTSSAAWALDRAPSTRAIFEERFGSLTMPICQFTAGPGAHVELIDLLPLLPELVTPLR